MFSMQSLACQHANKYIWDWWEFILQVFSYKLFDRKYFDFLVAQKEQVKGPLKL